LKPGKSFAANAWLSRHIKALKIRTIMIILRPHMKIRLFNSLKGSGTATCFALFIATVISCTSPDNPPAEILSKEQMAVVLREIYISEDRINRLGVANDSAKVLIEIFKDKVLAKHNISDSIFAISYDYYVDHPKDLELIYTALVDSLQLEEERTRMAR
jgi:hypothetical protein